MQLRRKLTSSATTVAVVAGIFAGGVVMAAPASADTCGSSSFELFTAKVGYCYDSPKDWPSLSGVNSYCNYSGMYATGEFSNAVTSGSFVIPPHAGCGHFPGGGNNRITYLETS